MTDSSANTEDKAQDASLLKANATATDVDVDADADADANTATAADDAETKTDAATSNAKTERDESKSTSVSSTDDTVKDVSSASASSTSSSQDKDGADSPLSKHHDHASHGDHGDHGDSAEVIHSNSMRRMAALEDSEVVAKAQAQAEASGDFFGGIHNDAARSVEDRSAFGGSNPNVQPVRATGDLSNLKTAGEILRYHRQRAGLSLNDVANHLRARQTTIDDIENNRLNYTTSANFISLQIRRYATFLGLDSDAMADLYLESVNDVVQLSIPSTKPKYDRRMSRMWLIVVLMILVATAGYFVFSGDNASEQSAGELKASVNGSEQLEPLDAAQPLVSGSLSMEGGNVVESNNTSTVVIEADSNKDAAPVEVVDANTARATAQAHALKQNELQAQREQQEADAAHGDQPDVLPLPQDSVISISNDAPEVQHNTLIEAPTNGAASDVVVNLSVEEQAKLAAQKANAAKRGDSTAIAAAATAEVEAKAKAQAAAEAKAKAEAAAKEAEAAEAKKVELSSNLRDISSQVKVQNRDGLASLNRAEINVKKDVALRVIDGSGKTLRSGTFKAGDTVQVNGIPPIRVQLSDTDAVSVSYMGGSINMPKREQVEFELPMR